MIVVSTKKYSLVQFLVLFFLNLYSTVIRPLASTVRTYAVACER